MNLRELKEAVAAISDGDDLPVKVRTVDQIGAEQLSDLGAIEERIEHGKDRKRQIVLVSTK